MDENICIASRTKQTHFINKLYISLSLQSSDKFQVSLNALWYNTVISNNVLFKKL